MNPVPQSIVMFIAGLMVGGLLVAAWLTLPSPPLTFWQESDTMMSDNASLSLDESGRVSVGDQEAGDTVRVDSITVPAPGVWVAVREVSGTTLGNVLGAARARAPSTEFIVPLLRSTNGAQTYAIVLYRDNGDDLFDLVSDSVYVDFDTGEPVVAPFATLP